MTRLRPAEAQRIYAGAPAFTLAKNAYQAAQGAMRSPSSPSGRSFAARISSA